MTRQHQLKELVRHIIRETLNELMGASSLQGMSQGQQAAMTMTPDPSQPPMDAMTPMEKAKKEREDEKKRRDALKAAEQELKTAKKEQDFQKQKVDQSKRFKIPTLTKQIQGLKGGVGG